MCLQMLFEGCWKGTQSIQQFCPDSNPLDEGAAGSFDMAQVNGRQSLLEGVTHFLVQGDGLESELKHQA